MLLHIVSRLRSLLCSRRTGVWVVVCALATIVIPSAHCLGQDFLEQLGSSQAADDPPNVMTLLARSDFLDSLHLNQGQRDQIAKILADQKTAEEQLQASHDEQLKAVTSIGDRLRKRAELRAEMRNQMEPKLLAVGKALRGLLDEQQLSAMDEKLSSTAGDSDSVSDANSNSESSTSADRDRSTSRPTDRSRREWIVDTSEAKASFAINDQDNVEQAQADTATSDRPASRIAFNFHNAPWPDVLKLFTDAAKLNLNLRDVPAGTFTYYDQQQYTPLEALDIMNRFLLQDGYLLVPHDRFLTVLDVQKGIPPNLVKTVSPVELANRGDTEYLRVAFALGDREASEAAEEVRGLLGPQGKVVPLVSANSIVVSDITANLLHVKQLLEPPPKVEDSDRMFRSFHLVYINASVAEEIVGSLFGSQTGMKNVSEAGGGSSRRSGGSRDDFRAEMRERFFGGSSRGRGGGDSSSSRGSSAEAGSGTVKLSIDPRTNTLLVTSTAAEMKLIEEIVKSLDVPPGQQSTLGSLATNEPYLQVYELNTANSSEVAKTLTVLHPGMVINEDGRADRIHIWADAASHREIAIHIRQLDGAIAGEVIAIIDLDGHNAYDVSTKLTALYKNDASGAPTIELDPSGRGLMIRGNASQIAQIRSLVDQLGAGDPYDSQQAVRLVPISSSNSAYLQQTIGALYPQITIVKSEQTAENSSTSRDRSRDRGSSSEDAERAERIRRYMEMRARYGGFGRDYGRGDSGRGGSDRGRGGSDRGGGDRGRGGRDR
ncbi:MAG: secretin N-terminal domain-containing protein [Pirellulales bacterium]